MITCPRISTLPVMNSDCKEVFHHTETRIYQTIAAADLASGKHTVEELEQIIEVYILDEYYERCAGIKRAIELHKKFGK